MAAQHAFQDVLALQGLLDSLLTLSCCGALLAPEGRTSAAATLSLPLLLALKLAVSSFAGVKDAASGARCVSRLGWSARCCLSAAEVLEKLLQLLRVNEAQLASAVSFASTAHSGWLALSVATSPGLRSPARLLRTLALGAVQVQPGLWPLFVGVMGLLSLYTPMCSQPAPHSLEYHSVSMAGCAVNRTASTYGLPPLSARAGRRAHYGSMLDVVFISAYDGDSFFISLPDLLRPSSRHGEHAAFIMAERVSIRVHGIDCPELRARCPEEQRLAERAKRRVQRLLASARRINLHRVKPDKYARHLADVEVDGVDLGRLLLREGLAVPYDGGAKANPWCSGGLAAK